MSQENLKEYSSKEKENRKLKIVKVYKETKKPKEWIYAIKDGKTIFENPPEIKVNNVIKAIDSKGFWRGTNPDKKVIKDIKKWRSDWKDPQLL